MYGMWNGSLCKMTIMLLIVYFESQSSNTVPFPAPHDGVIWCAILNLVLRALSAGQQDLSGRQQIGHTFVGK